LWTSVGVPASGEPVFSDLQGAGTGVSAHLVHNHSRVSVREK